MEKLSVNDLHDNIAIIKITKSYKSHKNGISPLELYDITRGCWKRKLKSLQDAEIVLAVVSGEVKEVYTVDSWMEASELNRETIPYDAEKEKGRIGFSGQVAPDDIRSKYIGKSVAGLYKRGEADPVKIFLNNECKRKRIKKFEILDAREKPTFKSINEIINDCMGIEPKGRSEDYWQNVYENGKFRLRFIELSAILNGKPRATANHCINTIEEDGLYLVFDDLKNSDTENTSKYVGFDLVFAKSPNEDYVFIGVYQYEKTKSILNHNVSKLLSKKVRLIGDPVEDIETLD